jgi:hypothetical protein
MLATLRTYQVRVVLGLVWCYNNIFDLEWNSDKKGSIFIRKEHH